MPASTVAIADEPTLNTAIVDGNTAADQPTTGTFTASVTETSAPTTITATAAADLVLDGANFTLTGDGTDAALTVAAGGMVTIENLSIANTGTAAAISVGAGGIVTFEVGAAAGDSGAATIGVISAPITGAGGITTATSSAPLVLSAANTYTGDTTIVAGTTVALGANGAILDSAAVDVAGTLDITGAQTGTGGVTFVTLNALSDTGTITLGTNSIATTGVSAISGAVNGTGGITVTSGTTTVTTAETYTGSTRIYGDLVLGANGTIADSSNVSLKAAGATLDISAASASLNELTGVAGSSVALGAHTLTVTENTVDASFSGVISGSGGLTLAAGPAELTLAGMNTYTGSTDIAVGATLGLGGTGTLGAPASASTLTVDGTLDLSQGTAGSYTFGTITSDASAQIELGTNRVIFESPTTAASFEGVISGAGAVQVGIASTATPPAADATALTLSGDNTYTGSTVVYGALTVTGSISDSSNVSLKVAGASVDFSGAAETGTFFTTSDIAAGAPTLNGVLINELTGVAGTTVTIGGNLIINETTNASFSGAIVGGGDGDSIVVRGPATLTLDGQNTYEGETLIKGHLDLGAGGSIANSGVYDNGVFDVSGATGPVMIEGLSGDQANATVILGANTLVVNGDNADYFDGQFDSFAGVISGAGGVTINDYLQLSNANTYTGVTTINDDLELNQGGSLASSNIVNNGELDIYASGATLGSVISGSGELYVDYAYSESAEDGDLGHGSVTITAADTYTGETIIEDATLTIGAGGSIANSSVFLGESTSVLDLSQAGGAVTIASLGSDEAGSTVTLGTNNLILSGVGTPGTETFDGVISGSGSVQINAGTGLDLNAAQTYTGSTIVYGVLELDGAARLDSSNVSLKAANGVGGTFDISGATTSMSSPTVMVAELTGQFGTHVYLGANTLEVTETTTASFGGVIADAGGHVNGTGGGLTVDGSAYLTLTNTETYTGVTTVTGDLALGAATGASTIGSIADSSGLVDNGFFAISGNATVTDLTGTGVVKIGPAPDILTVTENTAGVFSGIIHGAGILDVAGTHALTLTGTVSDYSGGTELSGTATLGTSATLEVAALGAAGSGAITFENVNSILQIDSAALTGSGTATESFANTINFTNEGGTIDLSGLTFETAAGSTQTFTVGAGGLLAITEGNVTVTLHTDLAMGDMVTAMNDTHGYTAFHSAGM
jgi:fibronectin-binding autotransporter adhesin